MMTRTFLALLTTIVFSPQIFALPSGAPVCSVDANFANITGMSGRTRNQNTGNYSVSAPKNYVPGETLNITITGPQFTGVMFTVVDEAGISVGNFSVDVAVTNCDNASMAVTHTSSFGSTISQTLEWTAPDINVGTVFIEGYILSGSRGNQASQQFYRFVTDDDSAVSIEGPSDVIFADGFDTNDS